MVLELEDNDKMPDPTNPCDEPSHEEIPIRKSVEDFLDSRAKRIMMMEDLLPEEIFRLYTDLDNQLKANNYDLKIPPSESQDLDIKRLFCGAVVAYELSSSKYVRFITEGEPALIKRTESSAIFEFFGQNWEGIADWLRSGTSVQYKDS